MMKNRNFVQAYEHIQPDERVYHRTLTHVMNRLSAERKNRRQIRLKRVGLVAACIVLLIVLSTVAIASYTKWQLPQPKTYSSPDGGHYDIHRESTYRYDANDGEFIPATAVAETDPVNLACSDEELIRQAVTILELAGLEDVSTELLKVRRQSNLYYGREEAEVYFLNSEIKTTVRFHAETGELISFSSIDYTMDEQSVCKTEAEATALAVDYYSRLPVPQSYVMTDCEIYDEQYWSFSFCREVAEGLYSYYEMVRIAINPVSGRLVGCNAFHIPLLDDHLPEDKPLTQEEAEVVAMSLTKVNLQSWDLESADIEVVHPNYFFTSDGNPNLEACPVTRLGWRLVYNNPDSQFADKITILVDLYNGEILGGDMTK